MPDLQIEAAVLIGQGDQVAVELTFSGTFSQPFNFAPISSDPFPPTNQPVQWTEMDFLHFNDAGQVDAEWALEDSMVMFAQLGVVPPQDDETTGSPLETPAGYQALSAEALAATFTSGNAARNQQRLEEDVSLPLGEDDSQFYANPYVAWNNAEPFSVTAEDEQGDAAFLDMLKQAIPDVSTELVTIVAEGDWVAAVAMFSGTFTEDADFFGTPLSHTGESISWMLGVVNRYDADGNIVEQWIEGDATPLLQGLGLISRVWGIKEDTYNPVQNGVGGSELLPAPARLLRMERDDYGSTGGSRQRQCDSTRSWPPAGSCCSAAPLAGAGVLPVRDLPHFHPRHLRDDAHTMRSGWVRLSKLGATNL